jgi:hypothetical protein
MGLPSFFKARAGVKIQSKQAEPKTAAFGFASRPKSALTETSTIPTNNSQLFGNCSFFCSIGANDWSMDSLIRRACSSCFKVFPSSELEQRNDCYYCKACNKLDEDLLGLTLSDSMLRDYQ